MSDNNEQAFHFVCTHDEALKLIDNKTQYWISNCGCRENAKHTCGRSRIDVCLMFRGNIEGSGGSNIHEVTQQFVKDILQEAKEKHLVSRPFRGEKDRNKIDGICFCCDDCCEYFINTDEKCDKGEFIEETDIDLCNHCGECLDVCYFDARKLNDIDELKLDRDKCYGCGLCVDVCPEDCIEMVKAG